MENKLESANLHTYVFIGRSGCGKGTQVEKLAEHLTQKGVISPEHAWLRIETGARFREFAARDNYSAKMLKASMERGERLPDNFAIWTWTDFLIEKFTGSEHLFFDGCPRSLLEAQALDFLLKFYSREKPVIVYLDVSREESKRRMLERGRVDDGSADIDRRLDWFDRDVLPAVEFYRNNLKYKFVEVDGEQSREKIHEDLVAMLEV
ncbi:MAG: nucleoside monophosphate kinase [Candidatus Paceibacterota bacterium]|jgi:adenylate kinase